jgi:hypothetical protein
MTMRKWMGLVAALVVAGMVLAAVPGNRIGAGHSARVALADEMYTLGDCIDDLEEQLPDDQRANKVEILTPLCESLIANLPESLPNKYQPSYFSACVVNSGGVARVIEAGPIREAALANCLGGLRSGEIEECVNSAMSIAKDTDQAEELCTIVYQSRPLGVVASNVIACATARLLVNLTKPELEDIVGSFNDCNQQLAKEAMTRPDDNTTSLPGAEECLRRIGSGPTVTDTAQARCAFILQALPAGVDISALAACIGGATDFQEAYRRCAEMLAMPTVTATAVPPTQTPTMPAARLGITTGSSYMLGATMRYCYTVPGPGFVRVTMTFSSGGGRQLLAGNDDGRGDCRTEQIQGPSSGAQPTSGCVVIEYVAATTQSAQACFAITGGPTATATATTCRQWDVSGTWTTAHSDNSYHPTFTLQQNGTSITGTATLPSGEQANAQYIGPGSVTGSMKGDQLDVVVTWPRRNMSVQGRYFGTVTQGRVSGMGVAVGASSGIGWTGSGPTRCVSTM